MVINLKIKSCNYENGKKDNNSNYEGDNNANQ